MSAGLSPTAAVATNKLAGTIGSFTSTISFYRSGKIDLKDVGKYFPLVFLGSLIGAYIVTRINPDVLKPLMLIMLAIVTVYTIFKKDWSAINEPAPLTAIKKALFLLVIFAIGFYDGFLGPGTGSFFIFTFLLLRYDFVRAAGNAKFLNFASNIAALLLFLVVGEVYIVYGLIMGVAQIFGAIIGSQYAIKKGAGFVRVLFISVTVILLAKNTYDYFF